MTWTFTARDGTVTVFESHVDSCEEIDEWGKTWAIGVSNSVKDSAIPIRLVEGRTRVNKVYNDGESFRRDAQIKYLEENLKSVPLRGLYRNLKEEQHPIKAAQYAIYGFVRFYKDHFESRHQYLRAHSEDYFTGSLLAAAAESFKIIAYASFLGTVKSTVVSAYLAAMERGYVPLRWMGEWPKGYLYVWAPPGSPAAAGVPADCVPTPEQLREGEPPKLIKAPPLPVPEVTPAPSDAWERVLSAENPKAALREFIAPFAENAEEQTLLDRLIARVQSIEVAKIQIQDGRRQRRLVAHLVGDKGPVTWSFAEPYQGDVTGLPLSLARLLRLANGSEIATQLWWVRLNTYRGKGRFVDTEWDSVWYEASSADAWDPFRKRPLIPISQESLIHVCHPHLRRAEHEPALCVVSADADGIGEPLPYGTGGVFLREALDMLEG
jgi:hypothetical protein